MHQRQLLSLEQISRLIQETQRKTDAKKIELAQLNRQFAQSMKINQDQENQLSQLKSHYASLNETRDLEQKKFDNFILENAAKFEKVQKEIQALCVIIERRKAVCQKIQTDIIPQLTLTNLHNALMLDANEPADEQYQIESIKNAIADLKKRETKIALYNQKKIFTDNIKTLEEKLSTQLREINQCQTENDRVHKLLLQLSEKFEKLEADISKLKKEQEQLEQHKQEALLTQQHNVQPVLDIHTLLNDLTTKLNTDNAIPVAPYSESSLKESRAILGKRAGVLEDERKGHLKVLRREYDQQASTREIIIKKIAIEYDNEFEIDSAASKILQKIDDSKRNHFQDITSQDLEDLYAQFKDSYRADLAETNRYYSCFLQFLVFKLADNNVPQRYRERQLWALQKNKLIYVDESQKLPTIFLWQKINEPHTTMMATDFRSVSKESYIAFMQSLAEKLGGTESAGYRKLAAEQQQPALPTLSIFSSSTRNSSHRSESHYQYRS